MNTELMQIWTECLILLEDEVSPVGFSTWIKDIKPIGDISLVNSAPLIEDYRPSFTIEWSKLLYEEKSITPEYIKI